MIETQKKSSFHIFRGLFFKPRMFEMAMARSFGSEHAANSSYVLTIRLRQQSKKVCFVPQAVGVK